MLIVLSVLILLSYTIYLIFKVHTNRDDLANTTSMIVAMSVGMISSLTIGLLSGIIFKNDLTIATILAIVLGLIVGYFLGKPINLLIIIEGMAAGVMGGMMGSMLGIMLPSGNFKMMLAFMDTLFIIVSSLIFLLINKEVRKEGDKAPTFLHSYSSIIIMVIVTIIICITAFYNDGTVKKHIHNNHMNMGNHNH